MPTMFAKEVKFFLAFILASILFLFVILYIRNSTTLVVSIDTTNNISLHTKIYFTEGAEAYSEKNTIRPFKTKGNKYYFNFPKLTNIKHLRFDPHNRKAKMTINEVKIIKYHWLTKKTYLIPLQSFKPGAQVKDYKFHNNTLSLTSTGNDPNIHTIFNPKKISKTSVFPIYYLFFSMLTIVILFYTFYIFKTSTYTDLLITKIILYTLFFAFIFFKASYYKDHIKFGYPPDEAVHFQYVQYVHTHHNIVPNFKEMSHYLSHPSLYYELIDLVYDKDASKKQNIDNFRSFSILLYMAAIILIFYLGFSSNLSIVGHLVYLIFISSIPMHAYLGSSITNDTLAMLGAIVFIIGLKRLLNKNYNTTTYFIIAISIFLAFFSKLTVALLLFFAIIFFLLYMIITKNWIHINKLQIGILFLFLIPIVYYQLTIILEYHALVPTYNHTHPEAYLKSGFYTPEALRQHLSPYQWFERMIHYIQGGWFGIHSHHSFGHEKWSGVIGLILLHIFALITLVFKCSKENYTFCIIGKISLLSLFSVLIIQYFFSYNAHVQNGYLGGLQPRYLLPFMFAFAIMASLFVEHFKKIFLFQIVVIIVCLQALYSDFFYFLNYYA